MILTFKGHNGSTVVLHQSGELQGYEFLEFPPAFRFVRAGVPITDWAAPMPKYVSLLGPVVIDSNVRTRGLDSTNLAIETRGLPGVFTLLIWLRE
jgi:hypothetical protein